MKRIILFVLINFLFINDVYALTEENELEVLRQKIKSIEQRVDLIEEGQLDKTYPIGSIYITTVYSEVSQVENTIGGKWEKYGAGKTLFGLDENNTDFNIVNKIGGSSVTTLTENNLPSHSHSIPELNGSTDESGEHTHTRGSMNITGYISLRAYEYNHDTVLAGGQAFSSSIVDWPGTHDMLRAAGVSPAYYNVVNFNAADNWTGETSLNGTHTHNFTTNSNTSGSTGGGISFTKLPPYITVYMYKRVA